MKTKKGNATIEISEDFNQSIEELIREAAPEALRVFESSMEEIKAEAMANWPVRQPVRVMRDDSGEIVRNKQGRAVVFKNEPSQRSVDKFSVKTTFQGGEIVVTLENSAEYAYLVRMGIDSKGSSGPLFVPLGARIWDKVVFSPVKKASKQVAEDYADVLIKMQQ